MGKNDELDINGLLNNMRGGGSGGYGGNNKNRGQGGKYNGNNKGRNGGGQGNRYGGNNGGQGGRSGGNNDGHGGRSGGNNGGQGGRSGGYNSGSYVGAPYNFVSFADPIKNPEGNTTPHNSVDEKYLSGEIEIGIEAKTHIFIDNGIDKGEGNEHQFVKNLYGQYVIPGSSIRGLVRSNAQILGRGDFGQDVDDYSLMYRAVAGGKERKNYADILGAKQIIVNGNAMGVLLNVQAGYIRRKRDGEGYEILQTVAKPIKDRGKMNYYVLNEMYMINDYKKNKSDKSFSFFFDDPVNRLQHEPDSTFKRIEKKDFRGRVTVHYKGWQNKQYKPYVKECMYKLEGDRKVTSVKSYKPGEELPAGYLAGYVLSSGIMQEKKAVYVIPAVDMSKVAIPIPQKDQEAYEIDYQKKEKILGEKQAEFFALPKGEGLKPVFYVQLGKRLYFGFTPRPRLFYAHTVKENMAKKHPGTTLDFASSMFGFSRTENKNGKSVSKSYKSKVSFSDAVIISKDNPVNPRCTNVPIVLSEPKSTSIADYLVQDGANVTTSYNDDGFELRGVKQYWLHKNADTKPQVDIEKQKKMLSYLNPLKPGTKFEGKVRFHNLTELELGLLLWSLKLEKDSWMNIGKAKSFGYGAIKVTLGKVRILNWEKAYSLDALSMDPWNEGVDVDKYIESFKSYLYSDAAGVYKEPPHIKDFFAMKDSTRIPNPADIRFMNIDAGEYRNRKALPTVQETTKNKK